MHEVARGRVSRAWMLAITLMMAYAGHAVAQTTPASAKQGSPAPFERAPPEWKDYFLKAKAAEQITDPLQRCLAYPDLPGVQWPTGHSAAHCAHHNNTYIPFDALAGHVRRGEVKALEANLAGLLAGHFAEERAVENIHDVFEYFTTDRTEADAISAEWLRIAPESAFANMARGRYLRDKAWDARGFKYASETPREDIVQMSAYFAEAIPLLRKAIELDSRMMPAYVSLLDIAMADSIPELERYALDAGYAQDPACIDLIYKEMHSLQPRWGGSYTQMEAVVERLKPHAARRPIIAMRFADPGHDMGSRFHQQKLFSQAASVLDGSIKLGSDEATLVEAANVSLNRDDKLGDNWKTLAYLLQARRFQPGSAWSQKVLGYGLVRAGEPLWAIAPLKASLAIEPDNAYAHYWLAAAYYNTSQSEMADRHYKSAMTEDKFSLQSAQEGAELWVFAQKHERAKPFLDTLEKNHAQDAYGQYLRMLGKVLVSKRYDEAEMRRFVRDTDPAKDRRLPKAIGRINDLLAEMDRIKASMDGAPSPRGQK